MNIVKKKISELRFDSENLRNHGTENIEMIKRSLTEFKQYKPLVVDKDTNIVKIGNGRLQAMKELGWKECYCVIVDFKEHKGMEVFDNRINELSYWNDKNIDDWILNDKGVDWWGCDLHKSLELLEKEKKERKSAHSKVTKERQEKSNPVCPHCGRPIHKVQTVIL